MIFAYYVILLTDQIFAAGCINHVFTSRTNKTVRLEVSSIPGLMNLSFFGAVGHLVLYLL